MIQQELLAYYPKPKFMTIIEPFCVQPLYSMFHDDGDEARKIILVNNDEIIISRLEMLAAAPHWQIQCKPYYNIPNLEATWFIDNPKVKDWNYLTKWCRSRKGQIIICETGNASWMKFKPLIASHPDILIWSNHSVNSKTPQTKLW